MNAKIKFSGLVLMFSVLLLANVCIAFDDGDIGTYGINALVEDGGNVHSQYLELDLDNINILNVIIDDFNNVVNDNKLIGYNA